MGERDEKRSKITNVTILGHEYPLHSHESSNYTLRIADFVDRRMAETASEQNLADPTRVAIMAAMDIADQILKHRDRRKTEHERAAEALQRLEQCLDKMDQSEDG
jgi:cell division protein ZapA